MKKQIKQLCIALIAIFCISLCTFQVFATPDIITDTNPVQTEAPIVTDAPPVVTDPITEPTVAPATDPVTEPVTEKPTKATQPVTQATQKPTYATQAPPVATNPPATSYMPAQTTPAVDYNEPDDNSNDNQTQSTEIFDSDKRVDTDNLDDDDWAEITNKLKNNGGNSTGGDFNFIKNNSDDGDNGLWILVVGILLILAGIGIIVTLIVLHIRKKNGLSKDKNGKNPPPSKSAGEKRVSPAEKKQINKRSKYDTAEIYIPKRTAPKGKNPYGGTRYKPKH